MPSPRRTEVGAGSPHLYFLDTNLIVYALGRSPQALPETQALERAARVIVQAIGAGRLQAVTSLVVLQELIYLLRRWARRGAGPQMPSPQRVVADVIALCQAVYTPTLAELTGALAGYKQKQQDFNDRLIAQAMRAQGIRQIVTADRGFTRIKGIRRLDPPALAAQLEEAS